jgi:hypothetical protein
MKDNKARNILNGLIALARSNINHNGIPECKNCGIEPLLLEFNIRVVLKQAIDEAFEAGHSLGTTHHWGLPCGSAGKSKKDLYSEFGIT